MNLHFYEVYIYKNHLRTFSRNLSELRVKHLESLPLLLCTIWLIKQHVYKVATVLNTHLQYLGTCLRSYWILLYIVYSLFTVFIDRSVFKGSYNIAKAKWEKNPNVTIYIA